MNSTDENTVMNEKKEKYFDKIRGSLFGGAVGDALGFPVEFMDFFYIKAAYGEEGITEYRLDSTNGKALISDDTQMSLFTANSILVSETYNRMNGAEKLPGDYGELSYRDWMKTQFQTYEKSMEDSGMQKYSWLLDVPELYSPRAPGNTCLSALSAPKSNLHGSEYFENPINNSKGCGGVMRVAPLGIHYKDIAIEELDKEGAVLSAMTHGHSLGYMPSAVLTHILNRIVYPTEARNLKEIISEARDTVYRLFKSDSHINELVDIINLAVALSENGDSDIDNIEKIGEGWVAEETLAIAIYCSLRYQNDFSKGIIASVNHDGDSDSTGSVTGNILGAWLGFDAIEEKWKKNLELSDVILEMADDLCFGCQMSLNSSYKDKDWERKYTLMKWKE